jgi:hypothetical protein
MGRSMVEAGISVEEAEENSEKFVGKLQLWSVFAASLLIKKLLIK